MKEKTWVSGNAILSGFGISLPDIQKDYTRERIKEYYVTHPCASVKDAAHDLGLSYSTLTHYRSSIRKEWSK